MAAENLGNIPGYEVTDHQNMTIDEEGQTYWLGAPVDAVRGFDSSEQIEDFNSRGGRIRLPMAISFVAEPQDPTLFEAPEAPVRQEHLFVSGVKLPDPNETEADRFARGLGLDPRMFYGRQ